MTGREGLAQGQSLGRSALGQRPGDLDAHSGWGLGGKVWPQHRVCVAGVRWMVGVAGSEPECDGPHVLLGSGDSPSEARLGAWDG